MQNRSGKKLNAETFAVVAMLIIFMIGYKFFYHFGAGQKLSTVVKGLGHTIWLLSIFGAGIWALKCKSELSVWIFVYKLAVVAIILIKLSAYAMNAFVLNQTVAALRLFFCSPLPYGIILILRKQNLISNDLNS